MEESDFAHLYKLEPGDKWCWIGDEIVVVNPEKIPFTINLKTGEILNMTLDREITKEFYCERSWIHYGY